MNWILFLVGFGLGWFSMSYMTVPRVRDHIHAGVKGLFIALRGFVLGSGKKQVKQAKPQTEKPTNGKTNGKMQKCMICKKFSPEKEMEHVKTEQGKPLGWIHPECQTELSERETTTDYGRE